MLGGLRALRRFRVITTLTFVLHPVVEVDPCLHTTSVVELFIVSISSWIFSITCGPLPGYQYFYTTSSPKNMQGENSEVIV